MGEFKRIEPNTWSGLTAPPRRTPRRKTWLVTWAIEARAMDNARVYSDAPPPDQGLWPCFTAKEGGRRWFVNVTQARSIVELDDEPVVGCPACSGTGVRRKEPTDG